MNKTYLGGIYQAKHENLINKQSIENLNKNELINYLKNLNYGNGSNYELLSNILDFELKNIREELNSLSGSNLIGDIFFMKEDLVNIKIAYKSVYYNVDAENSSIVSRFDVSNLIEFFKRNNDSFIKTNDLDVFLKLKEVDGTLKERLELLEKIYFSHIYNLVNNNLPELKDYIDASNFNNNLLTFLKLRNRNDNKEYLNELLLNQSLFDNSFFIELFDKTNDQVTEALNTVYFGKLEEGLEHFFLTKNTNILENALFESLKDVALNLSYNLNTVGPVLYYLHLKKNEVMNIRWLYYED